MNHLESVDNEIFSNFKHINFRYYQTILREDLNEEIKIYNIKFLII